MAVGLLSLLARGGVMLLVAFTLHSVVYFRKENASSSKAMQLHVPSGLDDVTRRELSLNLGGGECLWQVSLFW
jgi:hypothetical protein